MILNDVIEEYKFVYDTLLPCEDYFNTADSLITDYFSGISHATSIYFKAGNSDSSRNTLVNALSSAISTTFSQITILITKSYEFYGALKILETHSFCNIRLGNFVENFTYNAHRAIESTNAIIKAQLPGMKSEELLSRLVFPLQSIIKDYHTLINLYKQFEVASEMLLEPLPENIKDSPDYEELSLQSLSPTADMEQVSASLIELTHFFENIGRLCNDTGEKDYYLRKVETGSLLTVFATAIPIIYATVKLVDYCYPKFINWRQLYYTDKEQQLKLASDEIKATKELLEINPNIENADELLETASVRLFKYFKINPNFKINGKEYRTNMDIKLLQQKNDATE